MSDRLGDAPAQRHRRDHRRRHRPELRARSGYQLPTGYRRTRSLTPSSAARPRRCRSPSAASTTRRPRSTTRPPSRGLRRDPSTCSPTTPIPMATHETRSRRPPANGTVVITNGGAGLTYDPRRRLLPPRLRRHVHLHACRRLDARRSRSRSPALTTPRSRSTTPRPRRGRRATTIDVLANDTDVDGGPKSVDSKTQRANGTVTITGGGDRPDLPPRMRTTATPRRGRRRTASPTRSTPGGSTGTVDVTVTCVNDAPSFTVGPNQTNVANQTADGSPRAPTRSTRGPPTSAPAHPTNPARRSTSSSTPSPRPTCSPSPPGSVATGSSPTNPANAGTATITLHLHDDGGTANGGDDTSATQTFTHPDDHPATHSRQRQLHRPPATSASTSTRSPTGCCNAAPTTPCLGPPSATAAPRNTTTVPGLRRHLYDHVGVWWERGTQHQRHLQLQPAGRVHRCRPLLLPAHQRRRHLPPVTSPSPPPT